MKSNGQQNTAPDLNELLENLPIGTMSFTLSGRIMACTKKFARLLALKPAPELIGKQVDRAIPKRNRAFVDENLPKFAELTRKKSLQGKMTLEQKHKKAKVISWQLKLLPQPDKEENVVLCTIQDISVQHQHQLELTHSRYVAEKEISMVNNYLNRVIANMPCNVWWTDRDSNIIGCNDKVVVTSGFKSRDELIGKNMFKIGKQLDWSEGQAKKFREDDLEVMLTGEPKENVLEPPIESPDGGKAYYITTRVPLRDERNKIIGIIGISTDVTERIEMENELREANERAEMATKAKLDFLANFSHELRTPLNGILGISDILTQQRLTKTQISLVNDITYSGQMLLNLVNDILDLSKIESNKLELDENCFQLNTSIKDIISQLKHQAKGKKVDLIENISPELAVKIITDEQRFKQILINLIGNAIKFTEKGYVKISADSIKATSKHIWYNIIIEDTGIGISTEDIDKIFERYSQVSSSYSKTYAGTGLGLNIVRNLVNMMGGDIQVASEVNKGTTFTVTIKSRISRSDSMQQHLSDIAKDLSIFIVDDNLASGEKLLTYFHEFETQLSSSSRALNILLDHAKLKKFFNIIIINDAISKQSLPTLVNAIAEESKLKLPVQLLYSEGSRVKHALFGIHAQVSANMDAKAFSQVIRDSYHAYLRRQSMIATTIRAKNPSILLVEDNPINRKIIIIMLNNLGCQVEVAEDGEKALTRFDKQPFDLIFMDIGLPGMDGFAVTKKIRKLESKDARHPIIAMTAYAAEEDRQKCLAAGMDDFLSKPIDQEMLVFIMSRWLEVSPLRRAVRV